MNLFQNGRKTMGQIKRDARRIAKQLGYERVMPDIEKRINAATTEHEVTRVLITARKRMR